MHPKKIHVKLIGILVLWLFSLCLSAQNIKEDKGNVVSNDTAKTIMLQDVVITAPMKEVELRGDTTVINAGAYKTSEGAYLEELVKRIPGLEYDPQSHSITYNGLPINEINVNGESFFGGNMQMALENLPAKIINKIKVYDKRSELEKITKVRKGGENYVLDLQTKREFNGTMMASVEAALGNNHKRDAQLIGNLFKDGGENYSLVARTGNKNMDTRYPDNRQDNLSFNLSKKLGKGITLFGNAMYNRTISGSENSSYSEQYLISGNRYQYSTNSSLGKNRMGNGLLGIRWNINDKTFINMTVNGSTSNGNNTSQSHQASYTANTGMDTQSPFESAIYNHVADSLRVNDSQMNTLSKTHNENFSMNADLTRVLNDHGTSVSITLQYMTGKSKNDAYSISTTTYYQLQNSQGRDSLFYRNQYNDSPSHNHGGSLGVLLTQPLAKDLYLQISYRYNRNSQSSDRKSYEQDYIDSLSSYSLSKTTSHDGSLNLSYNNKRWELNAGMTVQSERRALNQKTGLAQADTVRNAVNLSPMLTLAWRKGKTRLTLNYNGSTQQPSLLDLLTLTDNSNPLNITHGNPSLKASYNQHIRLEGRNTRLGISADASLSNTYNSQVQAVIYNLQTGGRESYPINVNGNWSIRTYLRFSKRIKNVFNLSMRTGFNYSENVGLINEGKSEQPEKSITQNSTYMAILRLGYTPGWGGFDLTGDWRLRHSSNLLRQTDTYQRNYNFALNAYAELPLGLQLKSDASYSFRNGTSIKSHEDDQWLWNLSLTWRFLKKKQAELSFSYADILSDKKSIYRSVSSSGLSESHSQQIGSYFLVGFKYRFNKQM